MTEKLNGETTEKKYIRLPRKLVLDLRDTRYLRTGTSYASCLALATVVAKLTPITGDATNQTIPLRRLRAEWCDYGFNRSTLRSLLRNLASSPLAAYIAVDRVTITVTHQWLSAVVNHVDESNLNYIRVPLGVIPLVRTHAPAVDAVLYAMATRGRPCVAPHRHHQIPHAQLRSMIAEVQKALHNTDNTTMDSGARVTLPTPPADIIQPCLLGQ